MSVTPKRVEDLHGIPRRKGEQIFRVQGVGVVRAAPYDDHWIYETNQIGARFLCTCGSPAIVTANPPLLVCQYHVEHGMHQTGGRRWV